MEGGEKVKAARRETEFFAAGLIFFLSLFDLLQSVFVTRSKASCRQVPLLVKTFVRVVDGLTLSAGIWDGPTLNACCAG